VEEAYHGLLIVGKHPVAVINLSIPTEELDVNIHPAKSEIKFRDERIVFSTVQKTVRRALIEQIPVPKIEETATAYASPTLKIPESWKPTRSDGGGTTPAPQILPSLNASLPMLRVLGQVLTGYIVAEGPDGLYLIDQHAAHERVLFEKITQERSAREPEVQGLLEPTPIQVSPEQAEVLESYYQDLAGFGFNMEPFGNRTYLIRTVPRLLHNDDWAAMLRELLDSLSGNAGDHWGEKTAISLACHGAVRSGKKLNDGEMRDLVRQLEHTANPHTCPHGRPTMIHLSTGQLEREFGRR
jgi:DNA mismatch repair protein MutL